MTSFEDEVNFKSGYHRFQCHTADHFWQEKRFAVLILQNVAVKPIGHSDQLMMHGPLKRDFAKSSKENCGCSLSLLDRPCKLPRTLTGYESKAVPPGRLERPLPTPEAGTLSTELRGLYHQYQQYINPFQVFFVQYHVYHTVP